MEPAHLIAFNLTLLAAMASAGLGLRCPPSRAAAGGFATGLASGASLGPMATATTVAAPFGLWRLLVR